MIENINKQLIRYVRYCGSRICLYPKKETQKAIEFRLFSYGGRLTEETIWIPKSSIKEGKQGNEYTGLDWVFDEYDNQVKLNKVGFWF